MTQPIAEHLSTASTLDEMVLHPAFAGFGRLMLPWDDRVQDGTLPLHRIGTLLPYHSHVDPDVVVSALNRMIDDAAAGRKLFYPIYSEAEQRSDPAKRNTGLFFLRGTPGAPFAVISPGGGFAYVGMVHEGFSYAEAISASGYNAFVLRYRAGQGGRPPTEDLAAAISFIVRHAAQLGVDVDGYSLWGSSAGARMAASIGSHGIKAFGGNDVAGPAAVVMAYTGHSDLGSNEPPTFAVVGEEDDIARPAVMARRVAALRKASTEVLISPLSPRRTRLRYGHRDQRRRMDRRCHLLLESLHQQAGAFMTENHLSILTIGATGSIGRHVVRTALASGHRVRALVRDTRRADLPHDAELIEGDLTRPDTLVPALTGIDAVVFTHGSHGSSDAAEAVDYGGVRSVLKALDGRPVRVALMTTIGVTDRKGAHDWKRRGERLVRASGMPYTIVRPGWFDYNEASQKRLVLLQGDTRQSGTPRDGVVTRSQLAAVLVHALTTPSAVNKTFELVADNGPETVDYDGLFATATADEAMALDAIRDAANMPLDGEPVAIRQALELVRPAPNPPAY